MSVKSACALLIVRNRHLRALSLARSAESGITVVYATIVHSHEVDTDKLCIGSTCVTQSEFLAMVAAANAAPSSGSGARSSILPASGVWNSGMPRKDVERGDLDAARAMSFNVYMNGAVVLSLIASTDAFYAG